MKNKENSRDSYEIDIAELFRALMSHIWVILVVTVLGAVIGYCVSRYVLKPEYTAGIKVYVNNSNAKVKENYSISTTELNAAKSLVDTYMVILKMRPTLNLVMEEAGLSCTAEELKDKISAKAIDETEIFEIDVVDNSAGNAEKTANAIAKILPDSISSVVDGASVKIIEFAEFPEEPSAPNHKRNLLIGAAGAFLLICAAYVIVFLCDTQIHSEEYLRENYDIPVLGVIPDLDGKI